MSFFANIITDSLRGAKKNSSPINQERPLGGLKRLDNSNPQGVQDRSLQQKADYSSSESSTPGIDNAYRDSENANISATNKTVRKANHDKPHHQQSNDVSRGTVNSVPHVYPPKKGTVADAASQVNYKVKIISVENSDAATKNSTLSSDSAIPSQAPQNDYKRPAAEKYVESSGKPPGEENIYLTNTHNSGQSKAKADSEPKNAEVLQQSDLAQQNKTSEMPIENPASANLGQKTQSNYVGNQTTPVTGQALSSSVVINTRENKSKHFELTPITADKSAKARTSDSSPRVHIGQVNVVVNKTTASNLRTDPNYHSSSFNKFKGL